MFDANDDNIEQIGKKAAGQFFDESLIPSWGQLQKKLDIELPVKKKRKRFFAFGIIFTLLLSSFLYTGFEGSINTKADKYIIATTTTATSKPNALENDSMVSFNAHAADRDSLKIKVNQPAGVVYDNGVDKLSSKENLNKLSSQQSTKVRLKYKTTKYTQSVKIQNGLQDQTFQTKKSFPVNKKIENSVSVSLVDVKADGIKLENEMAMETVITSVESNNTLRKIKNSDSLISAKEKINDSFHNTAMRPAKKYNDKHGFTIAAIAGANINSVSYNKSSKLGVDYGFLVGYKLTPKLEIKTGIIFSRKYFTTTGNNISFDSGKLNLPSYTNIKLEDATGYCRFVEIPIMLYYSFPSKSKTNFYAGTGFSINKMRIEKIHYTFLVNSSTLVERTHTSANHNADGSSTSFTSNISFGLAHKLSGQWGISFEPYFRIPLTKVNDSNLKLNTFGVSASLILNLPSKREK